MRRILSILMLCMLYVVAVPTQAANYDQDMRGIWISTVYNLDYPSTKNNIAKQQQEFIEQLDTLQEVGINTVFVQVRPKADALYASLINPWSDVLTGVQGKNPGYDPMAFMIEETHKRGMEFHAWLNPYRVTTSGTDLTSLSSNHPARLNPSWVLNYNNALYYNPEAEGVKQHIVDTVTEIATYYNVDGIHFDDYFYPSNYPLPSGEGKDGAVANARREAINDMVKRVGAAVKEVNAKYSKSVQFGISPPGIWKNSSSDVTGSNTSGRESYYAVYADCRTWIQNGWIDYIVPQIYWQIGHSKADYETLVKWWSNEVSGTAVKLYIGQAIYTDTVAQEIGTQLALNKAYSNIKGSIYFSLRDLLNNRQGCKNQIATFYNKLGTGDSNTSGNTNNGGTTTGGSSSGNTGAGGGESGEITIPSSSHIGKIGTVTAESLNIRAGARADREIVTKVSQGNTLTILDILGEWYKVRLTNGTVGWANSAYITVDNNTGADLDQNTGSNNQVGTVTFPISGTVMAMSLNVRSGARVDREVVAQVTQGAEITVLSELNGWYKIRLISGTVGWVNSEYIQVKESSGNLISYPRKAAVTASSLNVRSGARTDRPVIAMLTKGTEVTLLEQTGEWYKVRLENGTVGWAVSQYLA